MRQRLGAVDGGGNFDMFAEATDTDTALHDFVAGFSSPAAAFQDRLLCAKSEGKWCSYDPASWSALRALTLTIEDDAGPAAGVGGELTAGGWRRGGQGIQVWGNDTGAGIRYGETTLDGNRVALTEYDCAKTMIGGEWLGTRMRPCDTDVSASQSVATTTFSDGPHALAHCVTDFAGNVGCTPGQTVLIDNNAPAHVRDLALAGGEGWRRVNDFDLSWVNPDQGPASPVGGALWRVTGPAGYDTGVQSAAGRDLAALSDIHVPGPGAYSLQVWLRDEAGNDAPATATAMPLRFDDVAPGVAFEATAETGVPAQVQADVFDAHSGPAGGTIFYRRIDSSDWTELPTKLQSGATADAATLVARVPVDDLTPGVYLFRADAVDGAGNVASTTRRSDGTEMAARRPAPNAGSQGGAGSAVDATRIVARLRRGNRLRSDLTVPFGAGATLTGRLTRADGAGLAGRDLRVIQRPSSGAIAGRARSPSAPARRAASTSTCARVPRAASSSPFRGRRGLEQATQAPLGLRVRAGVALRATPRALRTGRALRLSGRVSARGAPVPRRGKLVAIQYFESRTRHWRPVLVTHTDFLGRFHARYRFRYVTGRARIRLRAIALAEERWPYAPGASRPVTVRGYSHCGGIGRVPGHVARHPPHHRRLDRARAARRGRAEDGRELPQARRRRLLRRSRLPPRHPRLHDPGRLPGGHRHAAAPATPSRTSSTTTRSSAARWRWPTPAPTPTAPSSSSSPPTRRRGSTASTPSSARSLDGMEVVDAIEGTPTDASDRPLEPQMIERVELDDE